MAEELLDQIRDLAEGQIVSTSIRGQCEHVLALRGQNVSDPT